MSISIVTVGSEKQVAISNDQMGRIIEVGSNWIELRILARLGFTDLGASPGSGPQFQLGVMTDPTANMANGPKGSLSHFIGIDSGTGSWTRNAGPPVYYSGINSNSIKKVGATRTSIAANGTVISADSSVRRQCLVVNIIKDSPNWTVWRVYPNSSSVANALLDVNATLNQLIGALEAPTITNIRDRLNDVTGSVNSYTSQSNTTAAPDEVTNGFLTSVVLTWNQSTFLLRSSDLVFFKRL